MTETAWLLLIFSGITLLLLGLTVGHILGRRSMHSIIKLYEEDEKWLKNILEMYKLMLDSYDLGTQRLFQILDSTRKKYDE